MKSHLNGVLCYSPIPPGPSCCRTCLPLTCLHRLPPGKLTNLPSLTTTSASALLVPVCSPVTWTVTKVIQIPGRSFLYPTGGNGGALRGICCNILNAIFPLLSASDNTDLNPTPAFIVSPIANTQRGSKRSSRRL